MPDLILRNSKFITRSYKLYMSTLITTTSTLKSFVSASDYYWIFIKVAASFGIIGTQKAMGSNEEILSALKILQKYNLKVEAFKLQYCF